MEQKKEERANEQYLRGNDEKKTNDNQQMNT